VHLLFRSIKKKVCFDEVSGNLVSLRSQLKREEEKSLNKAREKVKEKFIIKKNHQHILQQSSTVSLSLY